MSGTYNKIKRLIWKIYGPYLRQYGHWSRPMTQVFPIYVYKIVNDQEKQFTTYCKS